MAPKYMEQFSGEYEDYLEANYPFSVKVEIQLSVHDLMGIHRDWYGDNPWISSGKSNKDFEKVQNTT
jgi:dipeptidase